MNILYTLAACASICSSVPSIDCGRWEQGAPSHAQLKYERRMRRSKRGPVGKVPVWHSSRPPARLRPAKFKETRMKGMR